MKHVARFGDGILLMQNLVRPERVHLQESCRLEGYHLYFVVWYIITLLFHFLVNK